MIQSLNSNYYGESMKTSLTNINTAIKTNNYILIIGLGFEKRCLSILKSLHTRNALKIIGVHNGDWKQQSAENISEFSIICDEKGIVVGENCNGAIEVADSLYSILAPIINKNSNINFLIDATGFSHELLVIVIGLLNNENKLPNCTILYTGADEYSFNTDPTQKWLSRGVLDVRSILGFPGEMLPSKGLHLVIMAGFEVERAAEIITRYEPEILSIGVGGKDHSVSNEHHDYNVQSHKEIIALLQRMRGASDNIFEFEFSCIDPILTRDKILSHTNQYNNYNTVVCPLNTKLSTIGATLAAIENPKIQLCYSQPREYNIHGYSKEGSYATIISLHEFYSR